MIVTDLYKRSDTLVAVFESAMSQLEDRSIPIHMHNMSSRSEACIACYTNGHHSFHCALLH